MSGPAAAPDLGPFDRSAVRRHRDRAAAGFAARDFLFAEVAERLVDRLDDMRRTFPMALDIGCRTGVIARALGGRGKIERLVQCDLSPEMARRAGGISLAADPENLPFAKHSFDIVMSSLDLHWVNDLPGALIQIRHALKPGGLFLGALLGGATLTELRLALTEAELEIRGGAGPRVSPMADIRDAGALLQRAGFAEPVADSQTITVFYPDPLRLMADLRGMGEANAVTGRDKTFTARAVLFEAVRRYHDRHARPMTGPDGSETLRIPATFEILFLTAWAPEGG